MKRFFSLLFAWMLAAPFVSAQVNAGIPADVFYLMPEMTQGTLRFQDRTVNGKFNICAVDQTLRFLNEKGVELALDNDGDLQQVNFGDIMFLHAEGAFYRLYPISDDLTVAYRRDVEIIRDIKKGAYGTESRTSSIRDVGTFQADGMMYTLQKAADYPYHVSESCSLYQAGSVIPLNKRSLRKLFPDRKDDLDAWLKANRNLPKGVDETKAFLARLASGEEL